MVKRITPTEAAELISQGWSYIDVRSIPEFDRGHPAGALNVPLLNFQGGRLIPNPEFQRVMEATFPRDARLVVGCKVGGRSAQAAALLEAVGFSQVADMCAGYAGQHDPYGRPIAEGWVAAGLPVETTTPAERTYAGLAAKVK